MASSNLVFKSKDHSESNKQTCNQRLLSILNLNGSSAKMETSSPLKKVVWLAIN